MGKRRMKIQRTLEKNQEEQWASLPQDILGIILGKLQDAADLIRFGAVCKNWHIDIPKERKIKYNQDHRNLPWLCNLHWDPYQTNRLKCEMYDPNSSQIFRTSKLVQGCRDTRLYSKRIRFIGSKEGWLIGYQYHIYGDKWEIFMYNPSSQEFIPLPSTNYYPRFATFSGNPVSQNCCVFLFFRETVDRGYSLYENYIASYGFKEDKEWSIEFVDKKQEMCRGMQYMKEQLLCLYKDGIMRRYNLADGTCTQVVLGQGSHRLAANNQQLWLVKWEGDLLVACEKGIGQSECQVFYFDWSNMRWVGSDLQESSAIFINDAITYFVRPFKDYDDSENKKGCKVYFFHGSTLSKTHPSYYSFKQRMKQHLTYSERDYSWSAYLYIAFIEAPYIN